jgi:hypothetical protein
MALFDPFPPVAIKLTDEESEVNGGVAHRQKPGDNLALMA